MNEQPEWRSAAARRWWQRRERPPNRDPHATAVIVARNRIAARLADAVRRLEDIERRRQRK